MTQLELAEKISGIYPRGVTNTTIAHIERGGTKRQPSAGLFRAMCEALGVEREDLLIADDSEAA